MRRACLLAAIAALVPVTSGCGGGREERTTTIPPTRVAQRPLNKVKIVRDSRRPRPHAGAPQRKPHLVPGQLWGRRFVAVSFVRRGDRPGVEPVPHTRFGFSRERFAGRVRESIGWDDGCNGFGGFVRVRGATMRVSGVSGTLKACLELRPHGKPRFAERGPLLMNFFRGELRWRLHGRRLVLNRGTQTLILRETRRRPPQS